MRVVLLILALLWPLSASATSCITISWSARDFLTAKTDAARAVAQSADAVLVVSTLFGGRVREGDVARVVPTICHQVVPGVEYYIAARCAAGAECQWNWTEVADKKGFEDFARNRHRVTRDELMEKLGAWQKGRLATEGLRRWLSTADAAEDAEGDLRGSLALAVVERIEDLLEFAEQAKACNPGDATWLREHGSRIYLERFGRLPKQETARAYGAWLEEQEEEREEVEDEWDPERLESDLEHALGEARPWDHTIDCFLRSHSETQR